MEVYASPFELILYGWAIGFSFHIALHFVIKGWTSFRLFDFWSGPRR
jgi:hypothetical protein